MSWQLSTLNFALRHSLKPVIGSLSLNPGPLPVWRSALSDLAGMVPRYGGCITRVDAGGVRGEWVDSHKSANAENSGSEAHERVLLYLHGGGYVACSPTTHRDITMRLSRYGRCRVLAIDYRKPPKYTYPRPLEDAFGSYQWLLAQGYRSENIAIAGDSAGGNLTLSTMLAIRERNLPLPCGAVCISPWADLSGSGESMSSNRKAEVMLPSSKIKEAAELYADGLPLDDPRISPLFADLRGLPPLLIHVGSDEVVRDDSIRLFKRARGAGVDASLRVWENAPHVFHLFAGYVPESKEAMFEIARFLKSCFAIEPNVSPKIKQSAVVERVRSEQVA